MKAYMEEIYDWRERRVSADEAIEREIAGHDEPTIGIREAFRAIWRIMVEIVWALCARIRSGRLTNPEPKR